MLLAMRALSEEATDAVLIAAGASCFYAVGIASGSHFNSDDVLYAQMARELLHSGNWLDNRWLGVVHFEKPPLLLWCLAASGALLGFGEAALRLPITLWSVAGLVSLYLLARSLEVPRRAALTATALLATSVFYLLMTRRPMTDMPLVSCALIAAAFWLRGRTISAGVFAGLAVLAKSFAALPLLVPVFGYALVTRPRDARPALLMLLVAAPWHVVQTLRHGREFWAGYFGHHVAARMTSAVVPGLAPQERLELLAREPVLLVLALLGLAVAAGQRLRSPAARFGLCWSMSNALPLIVSTTVLPHYLLPLIPGLALLSTEVFRLKFFQSRLGPLLSAALVAGSLASDQAKLEVWLSPDFSRDDKAVGQRLSQLVQPHDFVATYHLMHGATVFYSGGLGVSLIADDPKFLAIQAAVLMNQRQAGHAGGVIDIRQPGWSIAADGRVFVVAHKGSESAKLMQRLRAAAPGRSWSSDDLGTLTLLAGTKARP